MLKPVSGRTLSGLYMNSRIVFFLQKGTNAEAFIWEKAERAIDELTKVISSVCTFEKKYIY